MYYPQQLPYFPPIIPHSPKIVNPLFPVSSIFFLFSPPQPGHPSIQEPASPQFYPISLRRSPDPHPIPRVTLFQNLHLLFRSYM